MAASSALADDAASVHSSTATTPDAAELAQALVTALRSDTASDWLVEHSRTPAAAWSVVLDGSSHTGALLRTQPGVLGTTHAPSYDRVLLDTSPRLSVVVRTDEAGSYIDAVEATTCDACDEPERFVRDLVAQVAITGGVHRLMPGVELYVGPALSDVPGSPDTRWVAAWMAQRGGENLRDLLHGVTLERHGAGRFYASWPDGTRDTWSVVWADDRWQLDYARLADDSPLRLSVADARSRRSSTDWSPTLRPDGEALLLGREVMGVGVEPLTDAVWLLVLDVDGSRPEAVRVDPVLQEVGERISLGELDVQPEVSESWFDMRRTAVSPRADRLAVALPHRVIEATPSPSSVRRVGGHSVTALAATTAGTWVAQADGTLHGPEPRVYRHETGFVAIDPSSGTGVRADGRIGVLTAPSTTPSGPACGGDAVGGALSPDGSVWAVACGPGSPEGLHLVGIGEGPLYAVRTEPGTTGAVAWSPNGDTVAVAMGRDNRLVFVDADGGVVTTDVVQVRQIVWTHDADHLVTVHSDGTARWWPAAVLR